MKDFNDIDFQKIIFLLETKKVWWDEWWDGDISKLRYREVALQIILLNNDALYHLDEVKKVLEGFGLYANEEWQECQDFSDDDMWG